MSHRERARRGLERYLVRRVLQNSTQRVSLPFLGPSAEVSIISAPDRTASLEMQRLIGQLAMRIPEFRLDELGSRCVSQLGTDIVNSYPGEHYRLLGVLVSLLQPEYVVEIGTFKGMGALSLSAGSKDCLVETFDIVPWNSFPDSLLRQIDFDSERLLQTLADLSESAHWIAHRDRLCKAGIIFLDGPKDGRFEAAFLRYLLPALRGSQSLLVIDDIRTPPMIEIWQGINADKIDATSLGHWSGTGLVRL